MDEARLVLKVGDAIENGVELTEAGAAGVAAGMRVASMYIEAPRLQLHSMRQ